MFNDQDEPFCNPMAPVEHPTTSTSSDAASKIQNHNLSNEDFRKLMMTPSVNQATPSTPAFGSAKFRAAASVRGHRHQVIVTDEFKTPASVDSQSDKKKNKKKYYQTKKEKGEDDEENLLAEIMKKYRDRAKERRENLTESDDQLAKMGYNAVANLTSEDAAERRKQLIEESKYLGGDMEHTHLVKGLDYALLHKVKAEIEFQRDQETLEMVENELAKSAENQDLSDSDEEEQDWSIKSTLAQNIMVALFENNLPEKNDYFLPGRLAYVFDLENDCPSDAFTSVIRSKAECPSWESLNTLSTSEIVLNKLIEIFEELREQGGRRKKKMKPSDKLNDNGKFSFINNVNDFGTNSNSIRSNSSRNDSGIRSTDLLSNDLNSVYDQDLNVEVIRKQGADKIEKDDLDIYDNLDDYELPHHRLDKERNSSDLRSNRSKSRFDKDYDRYRSDRHSDDHYSSRHYRDNDRNRRSSSRDRRSSSSSSEDEKYRYKRRKERSREERSREERSREERSREERSREERSRKERTPEKEDRHNRSHYSSNKKRRY